MKKSYDKTSLEWSIFSDAWNLLKDYGGVEDNEQYWISLIDSASMLIKKYENSRFAKKLILDIIEELDRKSKELKEREEIMANEQLKGKKWSELTNEQQKELLKSRSGTYQTKLGMEEKLHIGDCIIDFENGLSIVGHYNGDNDFSISDEAVFYDAAD